MSLRIIFYAGFLQAKVEALLIGLRHDEMYIHVNGEGREMTEGSSLSDLLAALELQADRVAVEINLEIIDRKEFDRHILHDDDRIEILSFIGGGSRSRFQGRPSSKSNGYSKSRLADIPTIIS